LSGVKTLRTRKVWGDVSMKSLKETLLKVLNCYCSHVEKSECDHWEKDGCMKNAMKCFIIVLESSNDNDGGSVDCDLDKKHYNCHRSQLSTYQ
jgi:hypothetical protein